MLHLVVMTILLIEQFQRYATSAIAIASFVIRDFSKNVGSLCRSFQLTTVSPEQDEWKDMREYSCHIGQSSIQLI